MRLLAVLSPFSRSFLTAAFACAPSPGQETGQPATPTTKDHVEFFERYIRPVLAESCYECHSAQARKLKGKLSLDSRSAIAKGGVSGPAVVPGNVEKSRLIQAIRWTDPDFAMPPKGKLTPQQIERFEQWVKMGAPDPRAGPAVRNRRRRRSRSVPMPVATGGRFVRSARRSRRRSSNRPGRETGSIVSCSMSSKPNGCRRRPEPIRAR